VPTLLATANSMQETTESVLLDHFPSSEMDWCRCCFQFAHDHEWVEHVSGHLFRTVDRSETRC
jgi:hypothetical protein